MIGKLRDKIDIINFSVVSDGQGGTEGTERIDLSVWAKVTPLSGSRGVEASQIVLDQTYEIIIRYEDYPVLSKKNWFQFENRVLIIQAFQIINERRKYFKVIAKEDAGRDVIIYTEDFQPITDETGNYIITE